MDNQQSCQLVWGCEPARQLEHGWLDALLKPSEQLRWPLSVGAGSLPSLDVNRPTVLVESGLLLLERDPAPSRLAEQAKQRRERVDFLSASGPFSLIHLSDEEGLDGDELYPLLPSSTVIWRNFPYPRFQSQQGLNSFPIGPRSEFLDSKIQNLAAIPASHRTFPWAFMGTLWASGSRTLAASLFLRALPHGFFFGGKRFGQGLPLPRYREHLLQSSFALCPEGDRHLDTFRLYESLQAGCIPVVVDQRSMALEMLGSRPPFPVFTSWHQALAWVESLLLDPTRMDATQASVRFWWHSRCQKLSKAMRESLFNYQGERQQLCVCF